MFFNFTVLNISNKKLKLKNYLKKIFFLDNKNKSKTIKLKRKRYIGHTYSIRITNIKYV